MTATTPTGTLWVDLALFGAFFVFAIGALFVSTALEARKSRK